MRLPCPVSRVLCAALGALASGCSTMQVGRPEAEDSQTIEAVCEFSCPNGPGGLSGISRRADGRYLGVDDRGGILYELDLPLTDDGDVRGFTVLRRVKLEGRVDLEGCAVDPLDGRVWVSDECDGSVRQFDPATGKETASAPVPEDFRRHAVPNRSLEALTLSPDGLRMYVANEDTLTCDGATASRKRGGRVRIQEFVRTGKGDAWTPSRQFFYRTSRIGGAPFSGVAISGVSALCALDDGSLLVLEREMSQKNPLYPSFRSRLYAVSPAADGDELAKRRLWSANTLFANFEGLCRGSVLADGSRALVLVSDGGGNTERKILILRLKFSVRNQNQNHLT